ncbi:hypothetical protein FT663_02383 [Candidozyma haemuli var. vulneris]|nr:hypothetical protein FT662_03464 [[Candida] haemuloni var. vulneris]KAF3992193.1 hypothetical protein FT663_02383 [[Candida] haemuloni var. vulneris]
MEVDRQALLEQKRQRLQELKQRRLQKEKEDAEKAKAKEIEVKPEVVEPKNVNRVDFAVQVGESAEVSSVGFPSKQSSVIRFDKAIQVSMEEPEEDSEEEKEVEKEKEVVLPETPEPSKSELVNEALSGQLESKLNFPFSKLRLGIKDQNEIRSSEDSPFIQTHSLHGFLDRPIVDIKTTPQFPDLILVAYGSSKTKSTDLTNPKGLAIIFNTSTESVFPEFFLHATSTITTIVFDKTDAFRVVAGMENGRLALWDLTNFKPNQLSVLPVLQTSTVASFHDRSKKNFTFHSSPIVSIEQPDANSASPSVVSICSEGIINVWSLSILAFPKLPSKVVHTSTESSNTSVDVTSVLLSSHYMLINESSYHAPEFKFLNNTYLGSISGDIFKLKNSKDEKLVDKTFSTGAPCTAVHSIVESSWKHNQTTSTIVISSHMDWSLRIWHHSSPKALLEVFTEKLISKLLVRPGHEFQMVALNSVTPPKGSSSLDFWDLVVKRSSPICSVPLPDDFGDISSVAFDSTGDRLTVGSKTGQVSIWSIDQLQLDVVAQQNTNRNVDCGVMQYLDSINLGT